MLDKYYIGWVRFGPENHGLVVSRPRKEISNAITSMTGGGIPTRETDLATPHHTSSIAGNNSLTL